LAQGRTHRLFTKRQVLALRARDGGCRWPGCRTAPKDCEAHHIVPWSQGGATDLDNGVLLCRFHHSLVHDQLGTPDAWHIVTIGAIPHLVPPTSTDWARRPRPMTENRWTPPERRRAPG
ncbi:HNH endonuclease signature motif containing protein, partial [Leucobacter sp. M11]|uniref:HNH endonuclease signature motif containing protein n=1 Tax=Leucobacter sp. M11 TaxID=2993565 RepID=UPI002D8114B9